MQRRHRILATVITIAVALGLAGLAVEWTAASRWQEMEAWRARAERELQSGDAQRAPAWGEAREGSAFAEYARAFALARPLAAGDIRPASLARADVEVLLARWGPALEAMRAGARCDDARRAVDWRAAIDVANLLVGRGLVNVAVAVARRMLAGGRAREAVELLLDAATCGADHAHSPLVIERMIGCALVAIATGEAWRDEDLRALGRAELELLAAGLARIDARLERAPCCLEGEALWLASQLPQPRSALAAWRHGFSSRWQLADAVLQQAAACERLRASTATDWPARQAQLAAEVDALAASGNPLLSGIDNLRSAERTQREALAWLRLLRLAVAHHLGDEQLTLPDPLGALALQRVVGERAVTFRSAAKRHDRPIERRAERR